ncbi:MAG: TetR/AcrR family transcriptional regulator [Anaerolineaceae bacterium]|nr:MAG: TetR/AcrR family transcriptional regulator [Anaerolineaceae bacterium]
MKSVKDDRRVKYTKMVLKDSFISLLEKKDISQITVKEICENADINRATFYSHYTDVYDLLKKIENELLENVNVHLLQLYQKGKKVNETDLAEKIFGYIKENAKLCKLLLSERGDLSFQKKIMILVYDKIINDLTDNNKISREDAEYVYSFAITGCVGIVQKWLDDDMKKSPRFMADMVLKLTLGLISISKHHDN